MHGWIRYVGAIYGTLRSLRDTTRDTFDREFWHDARQSPAAPTSRHPHDFELKLTISMLDVEMNIKQLS